MKIMNYPIPLDETVIDDLRMYISIILSINKQP